MKQTVEEAARKNVLFNHRTVDRTLAGKDLAKFGEINFIQGAEWQSKQSPWINVNERLPENNTVVLTRGAYGFLICQLSSLGEWETGANVNKERLGITHWMPIPSFEGILESNRDVLERIKEKDIHNGTDMNIKISKEAYEKLIKEDLYFLNEHCPDSLELDHIKVIIFSSIDWYYPDKNTCTALKRIENRLKVELQKQKDAGKQFLSDQEIDRLIDSILKEE